MGIRARSLHMCNVPEEGLRLRDREGAVSWNRVRGKGTVDRWRDRWVDRQMAGGCVGGKVDK